MAEVQGLSIFDQGIDIIETSISEDIDRIKYSVDEVVEDTIIALAKGKDDSFTPFAQNLIMGIDSIKAHRSQSVEVARRTVAVSALIMCYALKRRPAFEASALIDMHVDKAMEANDTMEPNESLIVMSKESVVRAPGYRSLMRNFQANIDPNIDEPDIFNVFAGFALLAFAGGEAIRVRSELSDSLKSFELFEGDIWDEFDNS